MPTSKKALATRMPAEIEDALARDAEAARDLGFMARGLVQATLPHKKVDGDKFVRRNGNYTLRITATAEGVGLPYGAVPRLLAAWVTREAARQKGRELSLGDNLSDFLAELGLHRTGGERGDIHRLRVQARSLFNCSVKFSWTAADSAASKDSGYLVADDSELWWDRKDPQKRSLFRSWVRLSERFYQEIIDRPVPINMATLRALSRSPLAMDIYAWMSYRASYLGYDSTPIPWGALAEQFGAGYARTRAFRDAFIGELAKVSKEYDGMRYEVDPTRGLILKPGRTAVPKVGK